MNRTFCEWVGRSAHELVGERRLQELFTAGGRIFHQTHWLPLLQMQGSISEVKLDVVHAEGDKIPMVLNAVLDVDDGEVIGHEVATFVARDRDKYERELLLARKRLEELVDTKEQLASLATDRALFAEQMIGIVSHDLRNPLSTIAMGTTILESTECSPQQRLAVERIARASRRAADLVSDLLDFTQARIGKGVAIQPATIDLHDVVDRAVDDLGFLYPGSRLERSRSGSGTCHADDGRLIQMIGNLVSNAVTYGSSEAPVTVSSRITDDECLVAVHNHGPAIPDDVQERMFSPMVRAHQDGSEARSVGLGLYIVREIVEAHHGTVTLTSSEANGTTFTATFPCQPPVP